MKICIRYNYDKVTCRGMENKISHLKASLIGQRNPFTKQSCRSESMFMLCIGGNNLKERNPQSEFVKRYLLAVAKKVCQNKQRGFEYVNFHVRNLECVYIQTPMYAILSYAVSDLCTFTERKVKLKLQDF